MENLETRIFKKELKFFGLALSFLLVAAFLLFTLSCTNSMNTGDPNPNIEKPKPGDVDGDGILDKDDNCPTLANADQADADGDGTGDVCEDLECETNFCQDNQILTGRACDGEASVQCGVNLEGCLEEISRMNCVAGCQKAGDQIGQCNPKPRDLTAPIINEATGTMSHGSTITVKGEDFGTHPLEIEWLSDRIEDAAVGTNPNTFDEWFHRYPNHGGIDHDHVTNEMAWSGDKSLDLSVDQVAHCDGGPCASTLSYPTGTWNKLYITYWFRLHGVATRSGKISSKHMWLTCNDCIFGAPFANNRNAFKHTGNVSESNGSIFWEGIPNAFLNCSGLDHPFSWEPWVLAEGIGYDFLPSISQAANQNNRGQPKHQQRFAYQEDEWVRLIYYYDRGDFDVPNGEAYNATFRPAGQGTLEKGLQIGKWAEKLVLKSNRSGCATFDEPDLFGIYLFRDNPPGEVNDAHTRHWIDDIYIQKGTRARVELGDAPNYEDCTRLEIQKPTAWTDEELKFTLNYGGSFQPGDQGYIFVINENEHDLGNMDAFGNGQYDFRGISPGFEITLE